MEQVNIHQAKTHFSKHVEQAESGQDVIIAHGSKQVARLTAIEPPWRAVREVAIKSAPGKIDADVEAMARAIAESGFTELPVSALHAAAVSRLPLPNAHKGPFDRMLVAQSMTEPLVLLTADPHVLAYGGPARAV